MVVSFTGLMGGGKTSWIVEQFHKKPDSIIYYTNVPTSFTYLGDKKDEYVFKDSFFWSKWVKYISDLCFDVLDKDTFKKRYKAVEDQDLYIHNCKIFLDESHMILTSLSPKQIKGFVLFITMSRHVSVDLYLFAQTLSLLNRDIYQLIEMHYYAIPASARLFSNRNQYRKYGNHKFVGTSQMILARESFKPTYCRHYVHYEAGGKQKSDNAFRNKLYSLVVTALVLLFFSLKNFYSFVTGDIAVGKIEETNTTKPKTTALTTPQQKTVVKRDTYTLVSIYDDKQKSIATIDYNGRSKIISTGERINGYTLKEANRDLLLFKKLTKHYILTFDTTDLIECTYQSKILKDEAQAQSLDYISLQPIQTKTFTSTKTLYKVTYCKEFN